MTLSRTFALLAAIAATSVTCMNTFAADELAWPAPTTENRLATRWWWMGSAVNPEGITKQLEAFKAAGLGGVEICPIYGVRGMEEKDIPFLSPDWMNMLSHTYRETRRLDMFVDMTTGTGWPFGGPWVTEAEASKGLVLRTYTRQPQPSEFPAGKLITAMIFPAEGQPVEYDRNLAESGARLETPPQGRWVLAFQTGPVQKVKRSAPGGEGNVLDPYSTTSLEKYLEKFDAAFEGFQDDIPRGQFHDSFEYYGASWTPSFFEEFQKRRGYDLKPHLLALSGVGEKDTVARIRHDYRETLSDLHEAYMKAWTEWSHKHGSIARNQAHGGPGNLIDVYAGADIPECEIFNRYDETQLPMLKLASSAAHLTGKKRTSAESFTWLGEHFSVPLSDVKPAADFLFLAGVNHLFLHGIPYSPADAPWPGWQFYASVNFGPQGGLWRDMPAFAAYVARCQSILQDNKPSNDVLLYAPWHQFWTEMDPQNLMTQFKMPDPWMRPFGFYEAAMELERRGMSYDIVSDKLLATAKLENGRVQIGDGAYRRIVVPRTSVIPVETLRQLIELSKGSNVRVFFDGPMPTDVPGFANLESRRAQLKTLLDELRFTDLGDGRRRSGSVYNGGPLSEFMAESGAGPGAGLRRIARQREDGIDYFYVNRTDRPVEAWQYVGGLATKSAVILDPRFENRIGLATTRRTDGTGSLQALVQLAPGESCFVRTYQRDVQGPAWKYIHPAGAPIPVAGTWNVSFIEGGPEIPRPFASTILASWTEQLDPEATRFAGTAKYALTFNFIPPAAAALQPNNLSHYLLDLGAVADSARVSLNGKPLGTLWSAPYRIDLSDANALQPGENTLEIEVTNVAANRIRDLDQRAVQWKNFKDINVVNTNYRPMDASRWPIRPAGLLGPVTLTPLRAD